MINGKEQQLAENESIVITYDRATGAFLPVQQQSKDCWNGFDSWAWETLRNGNSIYMDRADQLKNLGNCERIVVKGGSRIRNIVFYTDTGKYQIEQLANCNNNLSVHIKYAPEKTVGKVSMNKGRVKYRSDNHGLTLVELIVTIGIIGIFVE